MQPHSGILLSRENEWHSDTRDHADGAVLFYVSQLSMATFDWNRDTRAITWISVSLSKVLDT